MKLPAKNTLAIALALLAAATFSFARPGSSYHLLQTYKFAAAPGSTTEYFDYVTVDPGARRVYLSRGSAVEVMNADTGALVGYIPGFKHQHGVALAPELNRGFISDGQLAQVTIFDLKTLKTLGQVKADPDTDCVVYDPATKRAFSMNGDSSSSTVIDAKTGSLIKTIALGGSPEFAVADGKGMIYANLSDKNQIAAIDARTLEVKSKWSTAPSGESTGLAIDREHRRLFSSGRNPQMLVVMDADNGKVIQSFPISAGTDAAAYDPDTKMIFVSTSTGDINVFHEDSPDQYSAVDTIKSQLGAKTMGLDTKTHNLFVDTADFAPAGAPTAEHPRPRSRPVLGTFRVLVYGP